MLRTFGGPLRYIVYYIIQIKDWLLMSQEIVQCGNLKFKKLYTREQIDV